MFNNNILKNSNPLMYKGKIGRLVYFITIFCVNLLTELLKHIAKINYEYSLSIPIYIVGIIILFVIQLFAIIKRLRDIDLNLWFAILLYIPYVNLICHILLICIKGRERSK